MRIKVDRLCELAGIPVSGYNRSNRRGMLREAYNEAEKHSDQKDLDEMYNEVEEGDMSDMYSEMSELEGGHGSDVFEADDDDDANEEDKMVDVDETVLVQELRRARRIMKESRRRKNAKKQKLQEMQLKAVIDQEVKNVLKELQLNSGWVYGKKKPTRSRKGYTHQGSFLKGIGFR